jgi:putative serine protease PepD
VTPPSDLWAGGAADRPRPRRPRRPGRTSGGQGPPLSTLPAGRGPDEPPPRSWRERLGLPAAAAALAAVIALIAGLLVGGGHDPSAPVVVGGKAGGRADADRVYAAAGPAVVSIRVRQGLTQDSGSGFLVDGNGTIVTNSHVVGSAKHAAIRFDDGGREVRARVRGTDPSSDLAVLRVDPAAAGSRRPLTLAESNSVRVGDQVVAIGYPLGLDRTATAGIVSGLERDIQAPNGFEIDRVIQTDAPINPGNSGGPLLDGRGRVVGINSQIATAGTQGSIGIGFAVPADTIRDVLPRLQAGERIERPFIGLTSSASARGGATVRDVTPGGPADRAGLQPGRDTVVGVDGHGVADPGDVSKAIARLRPGDTVRVTVRRGGDRRTVTVRVERRPERIPGGP